MVEVDVKDNMFHIHKINKELKSYDLFEQIILFSNVDNLMLFFYAKRLCDELIDGGRRITRAADTLGYLSRKGRNCIGRHGRQLRGTVPKSLMVYR